MRAFDLPFGLMDFTLAFFLFSISWLRDSELLLQAISHTQDEWDTLFKSILILEHCFFDVMNRF